MVKRKLEEHGKEDDERRVGRSHSASREKYGGCREGLTCNWRHLLTLVVVFTVKLTGVQAACDLGYFLEEGSCLACHSSCSTCSSYSACSTWSKNFIKNGNSWSLSATWHVRLTINSLILCVLVNINNRWALGYWLSGGSVCIHLIVCPPITSHCIAMQVASPKRP